MNCVCLRMWHYNDDAFFARSRKEYQLPFYERIFLLMNNFLGHGVSTDECGRYFENHTFDALLHNLIDCMIENSSVNRSSVSSMYLFTDILNTRMMKDINQKCFLCVWMPDVTVSTIIKKTIVLNEHQQKQGVALIYRPHF